METLKEQFAKNNNVKNDADFNEGYINWLEAKVIKTEEEKKKLIDAFEIIENVSYSEDEVKALIVQCFNHAFDCIRQRISIDKIPNKIIALFETIKKQPK